MSLFNFDSPEPKRKSGRKYLRLFLGFGALAGALVLGPTLAANLNLNSETPVEFGQGVAQATACDNEILVTPSSSFVNGSGSGSFMFTGVVLSNLDTTSEGCAGKTLTLSAYGTGGPALAVFDISIASNGSFESGDGELSNEGSQGALSGVTFSFTPATIDATSVYTVTIQSKDQTEFLAEYAVGETGPGGGTIFYVNDSPEGFNEAGAPCSPNCHYLEWAPTSWAADDYKDIEFSNDINFFGGGTGTALGTGYNNTLLLASANVSTGWAVASGDVAPYVRAYRGGGRSDWFIPSRDETYLISNSTQFSTGGFTNDAYYWSSTANSSGEGTALQLHVMNNPDGSDDPGLQPVYRKFPVRPIRAF